MIGWLTIKARAIYGLRAIQTFQACKDPGAIMNRFLNHVQPSTQTIEISSGDHDEPICKALKLT